MAQNRTLYLNNNGSKWVNYDTSGKHEKIVLYTTNGTKIIRRVNYWQSCGNNATANITYKGKKINIFADSVLED